MIPQNRMTSLESLTHGNNKATLVTHIHCAVYILPVCNSVQREKKINVNVTRLLMWHTSHISKKYNVM